MEEILYLERLLAVTVEFNPRKLDVWVGAVSSSTDPTDDSSIAAKREFILEPQIPTHFTHVQLRGSRLPNWFPGFYHALPSSPELVNLSASPSRILYEAWQSVHPDNFTADTTFIVNN
ncbi:uncharacterized protein [Anabrus simplex]|uniref:uncharacterized protein n=1 Tax=Anabrus simplex TaxID=316456 RepID=UPI0034DDC0DB